MIVGLSGSGKTTFALQLGELTGLPVFHCDQLDKRNGKHLAVKPRAKVYRDVHAKECWIIEGSLFAAKERLAFADTVIWLDRGIGSRLYRVMVRNLRYYGQTRPGAPEVWKERFRLRSYIKMWRTQKTGNDRIAELLDAAPDEVQIYRFKSDGDSASFFEGLNC